MSYLRNYTQKTEKKLQRDSIHADVLFVFTREKNITAKVKQY